MFLDEGAILRTNGLIERYGIHDGGALLPVPIRQVARDDGWVVCFRERMGQAIAMCAVGGGCRVMYVNACLTERVQRFGIAHEMGHVLAGHLIGLDIVSRNQKLASVTARQEREASLIGGMLLIPPWLRDAPLSDEEVAAICCVPKRLVSDTRAALASRKLVLLEAS